MAPGGKPGKMVKKDDLTIEFQFENPYWLFEAVLAGDMLPGRGQATGQFSSQWYGGYAPKQPLPVLPKYRKAESMRQRKPPSMLTGRPAQVPRIGSATRPAGCAALKVVAGADITSRRWLSEPYYWEGHAWQPAAH
jgi:hypothetical protein